MIIQCFKLSLTKFKNNFVLDFLTKNVIYRILSVSVKLLETISLSVYNQHIISKNMIVNILSEFLIRKISFNNIIHPLYFTKNNINILKKKIAKEYSQ